jgi:hypothetical protein
MSRTRLWIWIVASSVSVLAMAAAWMLFPNHEAHTEPERRRPGGLTVPADRLAERHAKAPPVVATDAGPQRVLGEPAETSHDDEMRRASTDSVPAASEPSALPETSRFPVMDPEAQVMAVKDAKVRAYAGEPPMSFREFAESLKDSGTEWPWR